MKNARSIAALGLTLTILMTGQLPALAASPCSMTGSMTESPSDWAKATMNTDCTGTVPLRTIVEQRLEAQEKVGALWNTRQSAVNNPNQSNPPSFSVSASCTGHGTDYWRTKAIAFDNYGADDFAYYPSSPGVQLVCSS